MAEAGERSIAAVIGDIVGNIQHIVRAEIRLAKAEAGQELAVLRRGAIWCGIAAVAAFFAVMFLLLAGVYALALWLPMWAAALIVGGLMLVIGAVGAARGVQSLKVPTLPRTTRSLKENLT